MKSTISVITAVLTIIAVVMIVTGCAIEKAGETVKASASPISRNLPKQQALVPQTGDPDDGGSGLPFPNQRFAINPGNCTITDNLTGLMWLKDANIAGTAGYVPDSTADGWSDAKALVVSLNSGKAPFTGKNCGYTDWRLPTLKELQSLIHYKYRDPALSDTVGTEHWTEDAPFINVQSGEYWSATSFYPGAGGGAWYVHFGDGSISTDFKIGTKYVWPVRGGQ